MAVTCYNIIQDARDQCVVEFFRMGLTPQEGCDLQTSFDETCREAKLLQEKLHNEEQRHRNELEAAEASKAQKERLEAELKGAEGGMHDANSACSSMWKIFSTRCSGQIWADVHMQYCSLKRHVFCSLILFFLCMRTTWKL